MKKSILVTCFFALTALIVNAQRGVDKVSLTPIQLPNVLNMPGPLTEFIKQKYPDFVIAEAYKIVTRGTGIITYEVKLSKGGDNIRSLIYDQGGTYYKNGIDNVSLTPIQLPNVMNMPGPLPNFLNQNYPDFIITKAFRVNSRNNIVTYELGINKGTISETLIFDQNGTFLRKEGANQIQKKITTSRSPR